MRDLTIGEVARRAGVQPSAIRYYESVGLLLPPRRMNKHRRYDETTVQKLGLLHLAQRAGFTLTEIRTLFYGFEQNTPPAERWQALAEQKLVEVDALIERAQHMKHLLQTSLRCNCLRLEDCEALLSKSDCHELSLSQRSID